MSKKKPKKRNRKKSNNSTLEDHRLIGKKLLPPMLHRMPEDKMKFSSWIDDHLPEMLWACLVISTLERGEALAIFFKIAEDISKAAKGISEEISIDLTHSVLPTAPIDAIQIIVKNLKTHPLGIKAIRPVLFFVELPGHSRWKELIESDATQEDAVTLFETAKKCLDHQSQESTDVRWLKLMTMVGLGKIHLPVSMIENFVRYAKLDPSHDDMRFIRPSIRAGEMAFRMSADGAEKKTDWSSIFWKSCLERTECINGSSESLALEEDEIDYLSLKENWHDCHMMLTQHFFANTQTSGIDAKIEGAFGLAFYSGALFLEMLHGINRHGITGRLLLRSLVECKITLSYLFFRNDESLWKKYREHGVGQAKLALLKFDNAASPPTFLNEKSLTLIANDDLFEEFVAVDIGSWAGSDLRKMSEISGTKAEYDNFYGWSSSFSHGSWSAVRDACFEICLNPLHRNHKIPIEIHRKLESTVNDAVALLNNIYSSIDQVYPGFSNRLKIRLRGQEADAP